MQIHTDTLIHSQAQTHRHIYTITETHSCICRHTHARAHSISPFSSAFTITRRQPKHSQVQACSGTVHSYSGTAGEPSACHPGTQIRQQDNTGGLPSGHPSPSASESYLNETQAREVWLGHCGAQLKSMHTTHHQTRTAVIRDTAVRTQSTENHRKPQKGASSSGYTPQEGLLVLTRAPNRGTKTSYHLRCICCVLNVYPTQFLQREAVSLCVM